MQNQESTAATSSIEAELIFTFANRAPEIILSFDGLDVPTPLFVELNRLGWAIPAVPPPPSAAIDWTPDPTTGADYTLRPWRVTEFRIDSGNWAATSERAIGGLSIEVLKRHHVNITDLRGLSEAEVQATAAQEASAAAPGAAAPAQGAAAPAASTATGSDVIFVHDPEPGSEMPGYRTYSGVSGRKKVTCTWCEGLMSESAQVPDAVTLQELHARGGGAWHLSGDSRPTSSGAASVIQMLHPEMTADDPQISKLMKLTGDNATVTSLASISGGKDAVLVCAKVPGHSVEMMSSQLRIRFPELIFRDS